MPLFQAIVLGLVQGLTEFIPVSSSGHLVIVPYLLGWEAPGIAFDTILHLGTLLAVLVYFWREWRRLLVAAVYLVGGVFSARWRQKVDRGDAALLGLLVLGTIPGLAAGYFFQDIFEQAFDSVALVALFFLVTAVLLAGVELYLKWHDRRQPDKSQPVNPRWGGALLVGIMQALAIFPGLSRSGLTISGGIFSGLSRERAARFSFLLSLPIILAAGLLGIWDLQKTPLSDGDGLVLLIGFAVAAVSGWLAIRWLLSFLKRRPLYIFSIYLIIISAWIIWSARLIP